MINLNARSFKYVLIAVAATWCWSVSSLTKSVELKVGINLHGAGDLFSVKNFVDVNVYDAVEVKNISIMVGEVLLIK